MITVVLVTTHWTPTFENCRRSLHQLGYSYIVLGWGEVWSGWKWRSKMYLEFLSGQDPQHIFVLMDSFDTLAAQSPEVLLRTFISFEKKLVFGAEWYCGSKSNCGMIPDFWKRKKTSCPRNKHINAGFVVGYSENLIEAYTAVFNSVLLDDQKALAEWINSNSQDQHIAIDSGSALVKNVNFFDGFLSQKNSCFYHFPGPLLKLGMMPMYDSLSSKLLGDFARPQSTHELAQTIKQFLQICLILLLLQFLVGVCFKPFIRYK